MTRAEWLNRLDWSDIGPKLLAALEDVDWALSSENSAGAAARVAQIFESIGYSQQCRDELAED